MVGDGDRAQPLRREPWPAAPRPASRSPSCGRCACAGRRRCAGGPPAAPAGPAAPGVVALATSPRVDRLEVVGDLGPAAPRRLGAQPRAQRAVGDRAPELGDERRLVPGLEQQAAAAVVERVLVDLQAGGDGHRARGGRARAGGPGAARAPRGGDEHVRVPSSASTSSSPGRRSARGRARRRAAASRTTGRGAETTVASHGSVGVERGAARAGRGAAPRAPPRRRRTRPRRRRAARGALRSGGGRREDLVAPREGRSTSRRVAA